MKKILTVLVLVALVFCFVGKADAVLITSAASISSPTVVDFSQFTSSTHTAGPEQVGNLVSEDIEWSTTYSRSFIGDPGSGLGYGFGSNGTWTGGSNSFTGLNIDSGTMRFDFNDGLISGVGGFINYYTPGQGTPSIAILASDDSVIETYIPSISTSGDNQGAFLGFVRNTTEIKAFTLSNAWIALDDLTFTRSQVIPEPATMSLLGFGLIGLIGRRRKAA